MSDARVTSDACDKSVQGVWYLTKFLATNLVGRPPTAPRGLVFKPQLLYLTREGSVHSTHTYTHTTVYISP